MSLHDDTTYAAPLAAPLVPVAVRNTLVAGLALVLTATCYLVAVRGPAILFDLRDAVSAICF